MCVDRMRSLILAILIGFSLGFLGSKNIIWLVIIDLTVIIALLIDAVTNFCPIKVALRKIFPECER